MGCPCSRSDRSAITSHRARNLVKLISFSAKPLFMPPVPVGDRHDMSRHYEVRYELKKTGRSAASVKKAVKKVGSARKRVEKRLAREK